MRLDVNGRAHEVDVSPIASLAHVLRDDLGLPGTKIACNEGRCGACTVLVDGTPGARLPPARSPMPKGAAVTTIEGLGADGLTPLQEAMLEAGGVQCGACTPGVVMLADRLPAGRAEPDRRRRCARRSPAISAAAPGTRRSSRPPSPRPAPEGSDMTAPSPIGRSVRRLDGAGKVTGEARFTMDWRSRACSTARSSAHPSPAGRIVRLDVSAAEAMPGVHAVITAADSACPHRLGRDRPAAPRRRMSFASRASRSPPSPPRRSRSPTRRSARSCSRSSRSPRPPTCASPPPIPSAPLVHEEWESYPTIMPGHRARQPRVGGDRRARRRRRRLRAARTPSIVEDEFEALRQNQAYLEQRVALARWQDGRCHIRSSTQGAFRARDATAAFCGVRPSQVQIVVPPVGGGFGGKVDFHLEPFAALLSRKARRPVKVANTRRDELRTGSPRENGIVRLRTAITRDGRDPRPRGRDPRRRRRLLDRDPVPRLGRRPHGRVELPGRRAPRPHLRLLHEHAADRRLPRCQRCLHDLRARAAHGQPRPRDRDRPARAPPPDRVRGRGRDADRAGARRRRLPRGVRARRAARALGRRGGADPQAAGQGHRRRLVADEPDARLGRAEARRRRLRRRSTRPAARAARARSRRASRRSSRPSSGSRSSRS